MLFLPLLRRATGAFTLAATFFACQGEPDTTATPGTLDPSTPIYPATTRPVAFSHEPNPVHPGDFADPFVLPADSVYYAYATNIGPANVPMLRSADLKTWTPAGDAMPTLPAWAERRKRHTWAPAVAWIDDHYVLFYSTRDQRSGLQCIGRAESPTPTGPFVDSNSSAFICQIDLGGSIDASVVRDQSGRLYVIWKNDGNCCSKPVTLWSQQLSEDGRTLIGPIAALLRPDQVWEGPLIEAPTMWQENGGWHLLYSGNRWDTDRYATGYAACDSPMGPCRKPGGGPVMFSTGETAGPGGAEVFTDLHGQRWAAYHGWSGSNVGYSQGGARSLRLDRISLTGADSPVNVAEVGRPE
jgi:beta-xylosidase